MIIAPAKSLYINIATTIDQNNQVYITDYFIPYNNPNNYKLLAKSFDGKFVEIEVKIGILEATLYKLTLNNNHALYFYEETELFDYATKSYFNIKDAKNKQFFCDILFKELDESQHIYKIDNITDDKINSNFIRFAKSGLYPYLTTNYIKNKPNVYEGKKIKIINIEEIGKVKDIVAFIDRNDPIIDIIYYL